MYDIGNDMTSDEKLSEEISDNRHVPTSEVIVNNKETCEKSATLNNTEENYSILPETVTEHNYEENNPVELAESKEIANEILDSIIASTFRSVKLSTDSFSFEEKCSCVNDSGIDMTDSYSTPVEYHQEQKKNIQLCETKKSDDIIPYPVFTENNINNMYGDEVKFRRRSNSCQENSKNFNRKTSVVTDDFEQLSNRKSTSSDSIGNSNRGSLYSVEEYDEENDEYIVNHQESKKNNSVISAVNTVLVNNNTVITVEKEKQKGSKTRKKSIFSNIFSNKKSNKVPKKTTTTTTTTTTISTPDSSFLSYHHENKPLLINAKKYRSAVDIREPQQSLTKRISKFLYKDGSNLIRRSFSFRDLQRKKEKDVSREKLAEMKNMEWAASLQSLVESDIGISYDDLSFVNYDVQNSLLAEKIEPIRNTKTLLRPNRAILRTQSMYENGYEKGRSCNGTSIINSSSPIPQHSQSAVELSNSGSNISLIINSETCRPAEETALEETSEIKICEREKSNVQKEKLVPPPPSLQGIKHLVRSRSLNHLDKLEMRQSTTNSNESSSLKDSKSEPDCTRSLTTLPPKNTLSNDSESSEFKNGRKYVLTRSQKSSSECFSVNFEIGDDSTWDNELFFPAVRGVTLFDSLSKLCELRSIDLLSCEAWLQDRESNTSSRVSFSQDTKILVGRNIVITAKGFASVRQEEAAKKSSSNLKCRSSFNSSVDCSSSSNLNLSHQDSRLSVQDSETNKRQSKQRWSGLFSNSKDNSRMEVLAEQLNYYAKFGVPTSQVYPKGQCESIDALYKLENDWKEIVEADQLCERSQQQQTALWELIKTEVAYIKTLKVVTDLFLACLRDLQASNLLKEIDTDKLFSNITEILDANVLFWRNSLFPLVRDMRKYKQPPCIENMCDGFLKIKEIFQPYFRYCSEQARCQHYCRENHAHNELFTAYLAWCETQRECNRLRLMDILVQPMQRLTKYGLLLKAILRNTDDDVEKDNLNLMIKSVDDFVNNVNFSLKRKQDNERIKGIIARIESYDVVESKDDDLEKLVKNYGRLDLNKPMVGCSPDRRRHLIMEGDLKLKDNTVSKTEVHCFLLTDMLLICKPSTKKGGATMRVIRQPYVIDRLVVSELNRETPSLACIYKNEFDMAVAAFILQNNDAKKLKVWKESIMKAQSIYSQAKKINYTTEESLDADYCGDYSSQSESDYHNIQLAPRSPLAGSSRSSRVSSLAHSHSGSVEINEQSSGNPSHIPSSVADFETTENRTASISSDDGVQSLPPDKSPVTHKSSFKQRMTLKTPNTLSVQPYGTLGQSLPNLTLGSPNVGTLSLNLHQNTLLVPSSTSSSKNGGHLLSPTHRGISYPPPSPTRGNLKRGLAISQNKNPPLIKTRHVTSTSSGTSGTISGGQIPTSFDFDVPIIAGISVRNESDYINRDQKRQTILRNEKGDLRRPRSPGAAEDVPRSESRDFKTHKKLSAWNDNSSEKLQNQT